MNLKSIIDKGLEQPQLVFVSGESGSGKTIWCKKQLALVREEGLITAGLLSPAVFEEGKKVGIEIINLSNDEKRQLAKLRPQVLPQAMIKKWKMDLETIKWANDCLRMIDYCDLLVIDELGPLEFKRKEGFTEAFPLIRRALFRAALIVVRPSLLSMAQERWKQMAAQVYKIQ